MELSRRDALAALAAGGASVAGGCASLRWGGGDEEGRGFTGGEQETLVAVARTVFPTTVTGVPEFVETYSVGRLRDRPAYRDGIVDAIATLDEYATAWYDVPFAALDSSERDALLHEMDVDAAASAPDGDDAERVRHFLVNELLYALYTTPTGGELVGIENPQGFPGGTTSYQRSSPGNGSGTQEAPTGTSERGDDG